MRSSGACLSMLQTGLAETGLTLEECDLFCADLGPGSFTGTRVGIVLAKSLAYTLGKKCAGADCFDLMSPTKVAVMPSKRGEYFIRVPGEIPFRTVELPDGDFVGYGFEGGDKPPSAAGFSLVLDKLVPVAAGEFVPDYLIEPSISTPKKPYRKVGG